MRSERSNVIPFPISHEDRLRIATRRLALAVDAQAEALGALRSFLAPLAAPASPPRHAALNKG